MGSIIEIGEKRINCLINMRNYNEIELELAWLVKYIPKDLNRNSFAKIRQAYLESLDPEIKDIRIREKDGKFTYTIKKFIKSSQETGYTKEETKELSENEFMKLWISAKKKIRKNRYFYPLPDKLIGEIDFYKDNLEGLTVVEVEFPSIQAYKMFKIPNWFGKEVTDSKGIYPPVIAGMTIDEVKKINKRYKQKQHEFE